jgi:hypothetical protein
MDKKYQYHIYNANCNVIVTVCKEDESYALTFARSCLFDYYNKKLEDLEGLKCDFICSFVFESVINLDCL